MKVTLLLCDAAQAIEGKLYMLGAGWNVTGPQPSPFAIALLFGVPWEQTDRSHHFDLRLVDEDGQPIVLPGTTEPMVVGGDFEVKRPTGVRPGSVLPMPFAISFAPLPLPAGRRYVWELTVDGESDETWVAPFDVRPQ